MKEVYVTNDQIRKGSMEFINKELLSKMEVGSMDTSFGKFPIAAMAMSAAAGTLVGKLVKNIDNLKAAKLLTTCDIVKDGKIEVVEFCENLKIMYEMNPEMFYVEFYIFNKAYKYQFTSEDVDKLRDYIVNSK